MSSPAPATTASTPPPTSSAPPPSAPAEKEKPLATPPMPPAEGKPKTTARSTIKLTDLLKGEPVKASGGQKNEEPVITARESFTPEQLHAVWLEFSEKRRIYPVEYQLLSQEYELRDGMKVIVALHNPVQETMLNNMRVELGTFLREKLRNGSIQVIGEFITVKEGEEPKKMLFTNRERFDHLAAKNPAIRELKDRFGLDPEF